MPFMIGFIALTWIVVNDAIILIDRINKGIINAESPHSVSPKEREVAQIDYIEQLIIAWRTRLQPIIVTTLTTIFWVLPLALQDEFWAWLGFTIIFWLFVWSFMTLVVVPILYYYLVLRKKIKKQKKSK
jgi:multidrug efflux pump subunit AcrB